MNIDDCYCKWLVAKYWLPGRIELPTFGLLDQRSPTELSEHDEVSELQGSSEALQGPHMLKSHSRDYVIDRVYQSRHKHLSKPWSLDNGA